LKGQAHCNRDWLQSSAFAETLLANLHNEDLGLERRPPTLQQYAKRDSRRRRSSKSLSVNQLTFYPDDLPGAAGGNLRTGSGLGSAVGAGFRSGDRATPASRANRFLSTQKKLYFFEKSS
jgi:hypothetical protein